MTELLAALLGALVGGVLSAWVGSRQTARVLRHETELAAKERNEAQRIDEDRRRSHAADQLVAALADFVTANVDDRHTSASFVRIPAVEGVHRDRNMRAAALMQAGASHAQALPQDLRDRWDVMTWLLRFALMQIPDRSEALRRRDASDLTNYIEYLRQSLASLTDHFPMPPRYAAPDARRDGLRPWGFKPEPGADEPDLTDWQLRSRLVGKVEFSTGEVRWYGPGGLVEDISQDAID